MFHVYVINSIGRPYIYVGLTGDLDTRLHQHNSGYERTTKPYLPFRLLFTETYPDRLTARKREKYLKSGVGKEYIKQHYKEVLK